MKVTDLEIQGLKLIQLTLHGDERGFFVERYRSDELAKAGLPAQFAQDNHSRSAPGILRGLHYQFEPTQGKLVGCVRGKIWDVAVDIRADSPTYGRHFAVELSDMNGLLLWMPAGFAHGFCVLGEGPADVLYKVDNPYNAKAEGGILWDDPDLKIPWPVKNPLISNRDKALQTFKQYREKPIRWRS